MAEEENFKNVLRGSDRQEFDVVMRGYDRSQVDKTIEEMRLEIEHQATYNDKAATEISILKTEVDNLKVQVKNAGPNGYAALGAQFEQTLRLAEEQAKKLISDAGQDAVRIRQEAKGEADSLTRAGKETAERLIQEAEIKRDEDRLEFDRRYGELLNSATSSTNEAQEKIQTAQREAAAIKSDGERYAAELRSQVHRETEEARALATELSQRTAQARVDLEAELKAKRDEAEQEALRIYQTAVAQAQSITEGANQSLADSSSRAAEIIAEAERVSREARRFRDETLQDSQKRATDLINQSRIRAEALSRKAQGYAENAIKDSRERLTRLSEEREEVAEFLDSMSKLMSTESMVSIDESEIDENK
jgi:cell division septum initiation protein DivIVA